MGLVPLMQATLYVFVLHVYFTLLIAHGRVLTLATSSTPWLIR